MTTPSVLQRFTRQWAQKRMRANKRSLDIERLDQEQDITDTIVATIIGLIITGFLVLAALWVIESPERLTYAIASFLVDADAGRGTPFPTLLAAFGGAVIALVNATITVFMVVVNEANAADAMQLVAEHDERVLNKLSEVEHGLEEKLDLILRDAILLTDDEDEPIQLEPKDGPKP